MSRGIRAVAAFLGLIVLSGGVRASGGLSFEDRVRAQEAIERVYYAHQLGATLPFEQAVPRAALEAKVRAYLGQSQALEQFWETPVTGAALQAELNRMAVGSRSPDRLGELFRALDNDSVLIQECLARPALVGRLARRFLAADERVQGAARAEAEQIRAALASGALSVEEAHSRRSVAVYTVDQGARSGRLQAKDAPALEETGAATWVGLQPAEMADLRSSLPAAVSEVGALGEDPREFAIRAILEEQEDSLRVASWVVPKLTWEEWWDSSSWQYDPLAVQPVASPAFALPAPYSLAGSSPSFQPSCEPDNTWITSSILDDALEPRSQHATVWTGTQMIVWGGLSHGQPSGTGSRYDPATDTWTPVSTSGAPSGRYMPAAVWTGSLMVVWGGNDMPGAAFHTLNTGGRYDPVSDTWTSTSMQQAPEARWLHSAVWTGTGVIVWGGVTSHGQAINSGSRYDPAADTWTNISVLNGGGARASHSAVWTGSEMVVWGGYNESIPYLNTGARYDPAADRWEPLPTIGAPTGRYLHVAVWSGRYMVIWGGWGPNIDPLPGARYDLQNDTWLPTSSVSAPNAMITGHSAVWTGQYMLIWGEGGGGAYDPFQDRWWTITQQNKPASYRYHSAVWTGNQLIVWGGRPFLGSELNTGARYSLFAGSWTPTAVYLPGPQARYGHAAVWTGSVMVIYGGSADYRTSLYDGARYDPALDAWLPMSAIGRPRVHGQAVWTGSEMIVWGAPATNATSPGGRYNPMLDVWSPMSKVNAPPLAGGLTMLWAGDRVIIWGGQVGNTGGIYDPETDAWSPTATLGAPSWRYGHTAVWTGSEMIVWGGRDAYRYFNDGGRYDPSTGTWRSIGASPQTPSPRERATAIWTGDRMVVWGGYTTSGVPHLDTGGQYDPATDQWTATTRTGAPPGRYGHTAVWTGSRMIVWGGAGATGKTKTGGIYEPAADSWVGTSSVDAPQPREAHSALWTGSYMMIWGGESFVAYPDGGLLAYGLAADDDGDGFSECAGDCNDDSASTFPGAPQICDGFDNDCSSGSWPSPPVDEQDDDKDGFRICQNDCVDTDANVSPSATEICNGIDDDCDSLIDEDPSGADDDQDGVGNMCDNCPQTPNPGQEDGVHPNGTGDACEDPDQDTVADNADNCPDLPNTTQVDGDVDGRGDECDVCPSVYNPLQQESVACLSVDAGNAGCMQGGLDISPTVDEGKIRVIADHTVMPDQITFEINVSSCDRIDDMEFFLNGISLGVFRDQLPTCLCVPTTQSFRVADAALLRSSWNESGPNVIGVRKEGSPAPPNTYLGSYVGWVRVRVDAPGDAMDLCLLDVNGGDCTETNQCFGGYTEDAFTVDADAPRSLVTEKRYVADPLRGDDIPASVDIAAVPDGPARLCVEVLEDAALFGTSDRGALFTVDTSTGAGSFIRYVPGFTSEIEFDTRTGRAFGWMSHRYLQEFDITTGAPIGAETFIDGPMEGLEFIGPDLYGEIYDRKWLRGQYTLATVSPDTGATTDIGQTGQDVLTGLAFDRDRGILYGVDRGSATVPSNLFVVDPGSGRAMVIGSTGVRLESLEFGPDGVLYGGTGGNGGGNLYRIDAATGAVQFVGATGFPWVTGLALVARERTDCTNFVKQGEQEILLGGSCGDFPAARAGADFAAECTSQAGADVMLDGSMSSGVGASPGDSQDLVLYEWIEDLGTPTEKLLGTGETLEVGLPLGEHQVTLRVTDTLGRTGLDGVVVAVVDTVPPRVSVSIEPAILWPPNHRMVPVVFVATAQDVCDPAVQVNLVRVVSSEPDDAPGEGDGHTIGDVFGTLPGAAVGEILLRAERSGTGAGRVYSVMPEAIDSAGRLGSAAATVLVPHSQAGRTEPLQLDVTATALEWTAAASSIGYNVLRGELALVSSQGSYTVIEQATCLAREIPGTTLTGQRVSEDPGPGRGFFYLVEYFDGAFSGYGTESGGGETVIASGDACH